MTRAETRSDASARPLRADARRNRARILTAAEGVIAEQGAEASWEEIARRAGVGSATLHRHFPSRRALFEEVFHDRTRHLAGRADELADDAGPAAALATWLREVCSFVTDNRGLTSSLTGDGETCDPGSGCRALVVDAGDRLLQRSRAAGGVRPGVTMDDLITVVIGIALAVEHRLGGPADVDRLVDLVIEGIGAARPR